MTRPPSTRDELVAFLAASPHFTNAKGERLGVEDAEIAADGILARFRLTTIADESPCYRCGHLSGEHNADGCASTARDIPCGCTLPHGVPHGGF
jgi:hypothetical protein